MSASPESRALTACREYVRVSSLIRKLTRDIGTALDGCPGTGEYRGESDESYRTTHLHDYYGNRGIALMLDDSSDVKGAKEFRACTHCVKANSLIQQRKAARQSLGAAKRQITKLGKLP